MARWSPWAIAGICAAVTIGTIHGWVMTLLDQRSVLHGLFPRDWHDA